MLRGKDPFGRKSIMTRNPNEWLRYEEIVSLLGKKPTDKTNLFDYLCIKLPNEVFCIDNVRSVTPSWTIDKNGYLALYNLMNNDFKRCVIEWVLTTFDYCTSNGRIVLRGQNALMERFLIRYDIYPSEAEKSNLRRVIDRWLHEENINFNSYYSIDMKYHDEKEKRTPIQGIEFI